MLIPHTLPVRWQRTVSLDPQLEVSSLYLEHKVSDHNRLLGSLLFLTLLQSVYDKLGIQWASCLLAFLTLAMLPFP